MNVIALAFNFCFLEFLLKDALTKSGNVSSVPVVMSILMWQCHLSLSLQRRGAIWCCGCWDSNLRTIMIVFSLFFLLPCFNVVRGKNHLYPSWALSPALSVAHCSSWQRHFYHGQWFAKGKSRNFKIDSEINHWYYKIIFWNFKGSTGLHTGFVDWKHTWEMVNGFICV